MLAFWRLIYSILQVIFTTELSGSPGGLYPAKKFDGIEA